jgi:hypothetical protein
MVTPDEKLKPGPGRYYLSGLQGSPQRNIQKRPMKGPTLSKMYQTISGLGHIKLRAVDPRVARPMSSINNKEVEKLERPSTVQMTINSNLDNEYATSEAIT